MIIDAFKDNELKGFVSADRGQSKRVSHSACLVAGIRKDSRGEGIGTELFALIDAWARENGIRRLELTVHTANKAAVRLYEKSGFRIEGTKECSILLNGKYMDEYYMAKIY